jgi:transposase
MRPSGNPEEVQRRRFRALELLNSGLSPTEVARRVGVDRRSVRRWRAAARLKNGLISRRNSGRPPKLEPGQFRRLEALLRKGARAAGYASDLWTGRRVAELIERNFGVRYNVDHVGRLIRKLTP